MKIKTGYLYHIKDEFFDVVNDENLMTNHERCKKRPTYFMIKENDILWFIPLSSKVEKYRPIVDKKLKKYKECNTILIRKVLNRNVAILIQNAFPTIEKYIDHIHTYFGESVKIADKITDEILNSFSILLKMKKHGKNLFFADIDKIKSMMEKELLEDKIKN